MHSSAREFTNYKGNQNLMNELDSSLSRLRDIIAQLRDPKDGCPWDLEQTHSSLKPYLIEESYEVLDAIDQSDPKKLCEELGDVLLQIMLHSQLSSERAEFAIQDVIDSISDKIIRRHPHIFKDTKVSSSKEVLQNWEKIKQSERASTKGTLDSVPKSLPALLKAQRMGEKAARVGFDWQSSSDVKLKIKEEVQEFIEAKDTQSEFNQEEEFGDLLFSLAQYGRKLGYDCELVLSNAGEKFRTRFKTLESLCSPEQMKTMTQSELEKLWQKAKNLQANIPN